MFVTPEPRLVVREKLEVYIVEDSVLRVEVEIIDVEKMSKITMITQTTRPMRFT